MLECIAVANQTRCVAIEHGVFGKVVCDWFRKCSLQFATPFVASIAIVVLRDYCHGALQIRTTRFSEGEQGTQRKSETADRALRLQSFVLASSRTQHRGTRIRSIAPRRVWRKAYIFLRRVKLSNPKIDKIKMGAK